MSEKWICVVETPSGKLVALTAGEDGDYLATYPSEKAARDALHDHHPLVRAYGAYYVEVC